LAGGLSGAGVRPGDRVAVLLRNRREWFDAWFGLARLGAVCVPVNILLPPAEVAHVLGDTGAVALVCDDGAQSVLDGLAALPRLVSGTEALTAMAASAVRFRALLRRATTRSRSITRRGPPGCRRARPTPMPGCCGTPSTRSSTSVSPPTTRISAC